MKFKSFLQKYIDFLVTVLYCHVIVLSTVVAITFECYTLFNPGGWICFDSFTWIDIEN